MRVTCRGRGAAGLGERVGSGPPHAPPNAPALGRGGGCSWAARWVRRAAAGGAQQPSSTACWRTCAPCKCRQAALQAGTVGVCTQQAGTGSGPGQPGGKAPRAAHVFNDVVQAAHVTQRHVDAGRVDHRLGHHLRAASRGEGALVGAVARPAAAARPPLLCPLHQPAPAARRGQLSRSPAHTALYPRCRQTAAAAPAPGCAPAASPPSPRGSRPRTRRPA